MVVRVRPLRLLLTMLIVLGVALSATTADAARKRKKAVRHGPPAPYVEKFAAVVMDPATDRVLYERFSTATRYPASLTKMMTLYLLFEQIQKGNISLSSSMTASAYAASQDPTKLGVSAGDQVSVEDAIKAIIVRSANDVAVMIAEQLSGSEYAFSQRMTAKARELGMNATYFVNASGLPDESQRSTAADLAILSKHVIGDFPQFYPYFRLQSFTWNGRFYDGHNNLLKFFDGADGLKTGYTRMSGFNLASSATRQGHRLIAVVMGGRSARDRDVQTAELLESEFGKMGLGRPAPVIMAMSPLVLDDEEAAASEASERASSFSPYKPPVTVATAPSTPTPPAAPAQQIVTPQAPVYASLPSSPREFGQGDTSDAVRRGPVVNNGQWGIQVGAHSTRERAEEQLKQVQTAQKDLLGKAKSAIVELDVRGETFFRVRFGAFAPSKAETLCNQIQKRGTSCLVVTDGAWDAVDSRASLPVAVR